MTDAPRRNLWPAAIALLALVIVAAVVAVSLGLRGGDSAATPGTDSPEAGFSRAMQVHHNQGVELALIARERSDNERFGYLTYDMATVQAQQSGQMYGWLEVWGVPHFSPEDPMAWMEGTAAHDSHAAAANDALAPMPGMATREQIAALQSLTGVEAEIVFLELMIDHHLGAVDMAEAILELSDQPAVTKLAQAIVDSQSAEIALMETLLEERR